MTALDQWFDWLAQDQVKSPHTLATYRRTWRTVPFDPTTATVEDVEAWWASRLDRSVSTRRNELAAQVPAPYRMNQATANTAFPVTTSPLYPASNRPPDLS